MWNRVILLTCGMVIGWGLANYWTCAPEDIARHRYRVTLGVIVAVALCLWIASDDPASGIIALSMVTGTAMVSYAARARQISSLVDRTAPQRVADVPPVALRAIILVSHALPEAYTGPEHWVRHIRMQNGVAEPDRGWFTRPRMLSRIRAGYQRLGSPPSSFLKMFAVQERLQEHLGREVLCAQAHPFATPRLESQLVLLASQGITSAVVVPIDLNEATEEGLRQTIASSHVEERGVRVVQLASTCLDVWGEQRARDQVETLLSGLPMPDTTEPSSERLDDLARTIGERILLPIAPWLLGDPGENSPDGATPEPDPLDRGQPRKVTHDTS